MNNFAQIVQHQDLNVSIFNQRGGLKQFLTQGKK
jgi:hypothetical protein